MVPAGWSLDLSSMMHYRPRDESCIALTTGSAQELSLFLTHQASLNPTVHYREYRREADIHTRYAVSQLVTVLGSEQCRGSLPKEGEEEPGGLVLSQPAILRNP